MPVGVLGGQLGRLIVGQGFVALIRLAMNLDVVEGAVWLDPLVGVAGVAIHVTV